MNYLKIYNQLVEKRKLNPAKTDFEKHHIKPKSLFPELAKDKENIVKLTYREHYIAHYLLAKIYDNKEMWCAFWFLNNSHEKVSSKLYEVARLNFVKNNIGNKNWNFGRHLSEETKNKISDTKRKQYIKEKHPLYGKHHTEKTKEFLSNNRQKIKLSEEHKNKIRMSVKGKHLSVEHRNKISQANKGKGKDIPIFCVEMNKVYKSIHEAARELNLFPTNIVKVCKGHYRQTGGYHFKYV